MHSGLLLALLCALPHSSHAGPLSEAVRQDCCFRESLNAIRDWEAVLATWEQTTPEGERTPVLPVPEDGSAVVWPNPIPGLLIPHHDLPAAVRVRAEGGKAAVERAATGAAPSSEAVDLGATVTGYRHPGSGGKDHWYHAYFRRFDGLLDFRPKAAPFALEVRDGGGLSPGANVVTVACRNVSAAALGLTVSATLRVTAGAQDCGQETLQLAPGASGEARLKVPLARPGGGVLFVSMQAGAASWWMPILTHVEDVPRILDRVGQILTDAPDAGAEAEAALLRERAASWDPAAADAGEVWRGLFEGASALRERLLLKRLDCATLLFTKRRPFDSEQPYMDAHHLHNPPGGAIYRLSPVGPEGKLTPVVDSLGEGIYRDLCLSPDGTRLLFSFGNGNDAWDGGQSYHIYEANVDGSGLKQLTYGPKNDCEPFYLPNGQVGFTSDRGEQFVMCGGPRHVANLWVMEGDGSDPRQLSFNIFNDFNPSVLPDGRILYSRWEYNERSVTSLHKPFTIHPDGTMMAPYYGSATVRPNVVMFPRAVPGSDKVMALFTAHHGQTHGPIGVIDVRRGMDGPEPLTVLTPDVPITGEKAEESLVGWYSDPQPLSEDTYLCSYTPTAMPWVGHTWGLYVGDRHGNLALVYRDPEISCAEPVPLVTRAAPHALAAAAAESADTDSPATLMMINVRHGLEDVPAGVARFLRIIEDMPRQSVHTGGVICTSGTSMYTVKRIVGTVPVQADGSACFTVPANRNVYFEVLDADQREVQRMRSVVCLKPGETRTCVGCHEPRTTAPPNLRAAAFTRPTEAPVPMPWGGKVVSFLRDVQSVLNDKCIQCHAFDRETNKVIPTDDLTDQFCVAYEELLPYLKVANSMRWDNPEDVLAQPPYTYGSRVSPLMKLLDAGHHDVRLTEEEQRRLATWIDANGVYYDRYESAYGDNRSILSAAPAKAAREAFDRRCAACHGAGDGNFDTWWLTYSRREVKQSRALMAPLARAGGGWGRCEGTVFASVGDPDYQALLAALTALREQLTSRPREDLLSLAGSAAEVQQVSFPVPPPARPSVTAELPPGDWVDLTELKWESGSAGWTPNGDGLPRIGVDVEGNALMLGGRRYPRGIGTHAPSEIACQLGGKFSRFFAFVGGAEARGTVVFRVFGDDKCLFDSGVMQGLRGTKVVNVPLEGVQRLRLVVTDAGDGIGADMANWAVPRLLRAAP